MQKPEGALRLVYDGLYCLCVVCYMW